MGHQITKIEEEASVTVALVRLTDLAPYERNARTHPQDQIEEIKASIRAFGFTNPILADLDDGGVIAAGHGRHSVHKVYDFCRRYADLRAPGTSGHRFREHPVRRSNLIRSRIPGHPVTSDPG